MNAKSFPRGSADCTEVALQAGGWCFRRRWLPPEDDGCVGSHVGDGRMARLLGGWWLATGSPCFHSETLHPPNSRRLVSVFLLSESAGVTPECWSTFIAIKADEKRCAHRGIMMFDRFLSTLISLLSLPWKLLFASDDGSGRAALKIYWSSSNRWTRWHLFKYRSVRESISSRTKNVCRKV